MNQCIVAFKAAKARVAARVARAKKLIVWGLVDDGWKIVFETDSNINAQLAEASLRDLGLETMITDADFKNQQQFAVVVNVALSARLVGTTLSFDEATYWANRIRQMGENAQVAYGWGYE